VVAGAYCAAAGACFTEIEDAGLTLYVACAVLDGALALTPCTQDEGCSADEVCSPYTITDESGGTTTRGYYCANREADCSQTVQDAGTSLYVNCPAQSSLTPCDDDSACPEDQQCAGHFVCTDLECTETGSLDGKYCASSCFAAVEDLGKRL